MMEVSNSVANSVNSLVVGCNATHATRTAFHNILSSCNYKVTVCDSYIEALGLLCKNDQRFNIVVVGVNEPKDDTFKFLRVVSSDLNLLAIVVSLDLSEKSICLAIQNGCCDYLSPEAFVNAAITMWQHLIHPQITFRPPHHRTGGKLVGLNDDQPLPSTSEAKKRRVVWSDQRHHDFQRAVQQLGFRNAVPNKILEIMKSRYPDLTRENIASHLQRYREQMMKGKPSSQRACEGIINNGDQIAPLQTSLANETHSWWKNSADFQHEEPYDQMRLAESNLLPQNQYQPRPDFAESIATSTTAGTMLTTQEEEITSVVSQPKEPFDQGCLDDFIFPFDHNSGPQSQYQPQFEYHAPTTTCEHPQQQHDDDDNWLPKRFDSDIVTMDTDGEHQQEEKASVVSRFRHFCSDPIRIPPRLVFQESQTSLRNGWLDMDPNFS